MTLKELDYANKQIDIRITEIKTHIKNYWGTDETLIQSIIDHKELQLNRLLENYYNLRKQKDQIIEARKDYQCQINPMEH